MLSSDISTAQKEGIARALLKLSQGVADVDEIS